MIRHHMIVEHRYQGHFLKSRRFRPGKELISIGSTRGADFRLLGENVSGVHATVEFRGQHWVLNDLGSHTGTFVHGEPIVEYIVKGPTTVIIGGHEITLNPRVDHDMVFDQDCAPVEMAQGQVFHQVVRRLNSMVIDSTLLGAREPFEFLYGAETKQLSPPQGYNWQITEFGSLTVQQRLVKADAHPFEDKLDRRIMHTPEGKIMAGAIAGLMLILLVVFLSPDKKLDEKFEPIKENKYTQMIYDAQAVRQRREQSKKMTQQISKQAAQPALEPKEAKAAPVKGAVAKQAISQIRSKNLSQLIGRISKRASTTGTMTAMAAESGKAASPSTQLVASVGARNPADLKAGETYKLGSVATKGKGGGATNLAAVGKLSGGSVGQGAVEGIEEETEVDGGLPREVIAEYIKSQLGHIRYCYERQLSASPDLYGKLLIKFSIGSTGQVTTQSIGPGSTLKNSMVEGCILRRVAGWKFPEPKGGTSVFVTYPFLFKSNN